MGGTLGYDESELFKFPCGRAETEAGGDGRGLGINEGREAKRVDFVLLFSGETKSSPLFGSCVM